MRLSLQQKISATILGVIALAVLTGTIALASVWQLGQMIDVMSTQSVFSIEAASKMELALFEQKADASSYLVDGDPAWLKNLEDDESRFELWRREAEYAARTSQDRQVLDQIPGVYNEYRRERQEVIALYQAGEAPNSKTLEEADQRFQETIRLCNALLNQNIRFLRDANGNANQTAIGVTALVAGCVFLTLAMGGGLFWLFYAHVLRPLRVMVADARLYSTEFSGREVEGPGDELRTIGAYLRMLMSDVADTRTTLERSRTQLMNAEKLASMGKLAASIAHEIRNPLTSMRMWLFSIRKAIHHDAELERKLDLVSGEIIRLESVVRNFLEFARPPALKLLTVPVSQLIDKTLELAHHRIEDRNILLIRRDAHALPHVLGDADQLKQVLINLLSNAAEACSQQGEIRVSTSLERDESGRQMVVIRVADNGVGVPQEVASRIFEPFFTTKDEGTGLGLCIAARIMASHSGRLVLEPPGGSGASFAVWLPIAMMEGNEQDPGR
ncbi:MAG: MCP four helix bundle domain-containing protein [Planctomycetes bacterium]|nr:MCP four helix bundle domain-containing protein [Planctomycetota bacterium]